MQSMNVGRKNVKSALTLTSLAEGYIGRGLTIVHEYYGNYEARYREMRQEIMDEINPLLIKHGAEPVSLDLVPDPDLPDED
jgi:hypothetical protein